MATYHDETELQRSAPEFAAPTLAEIRHAADVLRGTIRRTPLLRCDTLDRRTNTTVLIKPECLQRTGSFKLRGAYHKISSIPPAERQRGVVAFSSGNHAQAVALAARLLQTHAEILMPNDTPAAKLHATRAHGAEVVFYSREHDDREALAMSLAEQQGMTLVHPYDDPLVIAGQGTLALELIDDAGPDGLDALVVPISGGGLIAGCAIVVKGLNPNIKMIGVEPQDGNDTQRSLHAGRRIRIPSPHTIADALRAVEPGRLTFEVLRQLVDDVVVVSDQALVAAMRFCFEYLHLVVEPAGAASIAAVLSGRAGPAGSRVGAVISGGNINLEQFVALTTGRDTA